MSHTVKRDAFRELIDEHAALRPIGDGFTFTEGPIWHPVEAYLLFSDMPADVRRRWDPAGGVREVKRPSNKCNGMTYDADLNLIVCEHSTSSLVRERPDGSRDVLASHFEGRELNSPNDVCVRSDGSIYFTDPWYGRMPVFGVERRRELGFQGVYRVPPGGGGPQLVVDRYLFDQPNGLCFSPDERLLYVNDTTNALIRVFEVNHDGSLARGRLFASGLKSESLPGVPDGMKCDARGNIWVTAPGGIWVFDPTGAHLGTVRVPELVANLHWGGRHWKKLYIAASDKVYALDTRVGGRREPFMRHEPAARHDAPQAAAARPAATPREGAAASASGLEIRILDYGDIELEASFLVLGHDCGKEARVPCYGYLILGGPWPILVDTGFRSNEIMQTLGMRGRQTPEKEIRNQLALHGLELGDIRYVLHTHLHFDHAGKDDRFPMNTTVVVNRRELEYSVSGLMHPQYPREDIKHLIDRLHTKNALRLLDLELTGRIEIVPGVYCEPANAHTEGSMNVVVETAAGTANICGDVIYDIHNQVIDPFHQTQFMEWQVTGNHAGSKRAEKAAITKLLHCGNRFLLPIHDVPAVVEHGEVVGRIRDRIPGPVAEELPPRAWFPV